jgi:hypothetical protein
MSTTKQGYCKPTIRIVEWDYNESICNSVITNSFNSCLRVEKGTRVNVQENRLDITGDWEWTRSGSK